MKLAATLLPLLLLAVAISNACQLNIMSAILRANLAAWLYLAQAKKI